MKGSYFKTSIIKKLKLSNKKIVLIFVVILIISFILFVFMGFVNPIVLDTVEIKSKSLATKAINSSVSDVVMNSVIYDDLVNIVNDNKGNISLIQANSLRINNLSKDLAQNCESRIEEYGRIGVAIPVGTFTGVSLFVGRGPKIAIKMSPIGSVTCRFKSYFESAGINQTIHKIYVSIKANVGVVLPLGSRHFIAEQEVLISESVIVGQVPEVYLYSDTLDSLLNFVPY